ncbi:MAG: response regulator [Verrucomicrobia bacterium]|nr:response regulator [Verrucomicrobiota bacterium]
MPAPNQTSRRVLFVDDDRRFLETMKELMAAFSEGRWEILTAQSASQAFAVLQEQTVDLAVIDVQMPVMDGVQMLSLLNRGYPNLTKVVLTGFANENYRAACLSNGAELFLEKPKSRDELQSLYATLNELLKWGRPQGFRGVMRRVELPELIQMECVEGHSSVLEINSEGISGRIFVHGGALVHADAGDKKGQAALNLLLSLRGGDFKLAPFAGPPEQTLSGSWEELLLQATQARDRVNIRVPEETPTPPVGLKTRPATATPPAQALDETATETNRPNIEEMLICSAQGEVLHEWRCAELDQWIKFLEFVSQKSQRLAQGVVLGEFDRLEMLREDSRIVVLIAPDRGVMIRTRRERGAGSSDSSASRGGTRLAISNETKELLSQWLREAPSARGVLVRGLRFIDQTITCDLDSRDFPVYPPDLALQPRGAALRLPGGRHHARRGRADQTGGD